MVINLNFCSDFEHFNQDFEVEVGPYFEAEVWSVFLGYIKLNLGRDSDARFGHDFEV